MLGAGSLHVEEAWGAIDPKVSPGNVYVHMYVCVCIHNVYVQCTMCIMCM